MMRDCDYPFQGPARKANRPRLQAPNRREYTGQTDGRVATSQHENAPEVSAQGTDSQLHRTDYGRIGDDVCNESVNAIIQCYIDMYKWSTTSEYSNHTMLTQHQTSQVAVRQHSKAWLKPGPETRSAKMTTGHRVRIKTKQARVTSKQQKQRL